MLFAYLGKHSKCLSGKCLCFTGFVGTGCQTKHFQGYAMVFNKSNYLSVEPLGKVRSFTFEAWIRLTSLPEPGAPMKIFHAEKSLALNFISHGRLSLSINGNLPQNVVFDARNAILKPLIWYVLSLENILQHFFLYTKILLVKLALSIVVTTYTNIFNRYGLHKYFPHTNQYANITLCSNNPLLQQ